jgi:hypothetical protein
MAKSNAKRKQSPKHVLKVPLEQHHYASTTINLRLGAVRRLAFEAADCGLLSADLAAGIRRDVSGQTTERYLGCKQRFRNAVNDRIGLEPDTVGSQLIPPRWPTIRSNLGPAQDSIELPKIGRSITH